MSNDPSSGVAFAEWPPELDFILPKLHRFTYQPHVQTPMEGRNVRRRPNGPPIQYFGDELRVDEATYQRLKRLHADCEARRQLIALVAPDTGEAVAVRFIADPQSFRGILEIVQSTTLIEGERQTNIVVFSIALQVIGRIG